MSDSPASRRAFATLAAAAFVDGEYSDREREVLHRKALQLEISQTTMNEMIDLGRRGRLAVSIPKESGERSALMEHLIDLVVADGRVEAAEHHLLAKFASHVGIGLPELRERVKQRMASGRTKQRKREDAATDLFVRAERPKPPPRQEPAAPRPPEPAPAPSAPGPMSLPELAPDAGPPTLSLPPGPVRLEPSRPEERGIRDVPPVTLQLLKQAISFESHADAVRYVERTMTLERDEAEALVREILEAFPDLKAGAQRLQGRHR